MPPLQHNQLLPQTRFSAISSAFGLKIAAIAKISNRNTCAPPPPSFQQERRAGDLSML
jgi:hypothetical protein